METEKLKFKIGLSGTHPDKQPHFFLGINGEMKIEGQLTKQPDETEYFEFEAELAEGDHTLEIELLNKGYGDTVLDENNNIICDMLLNIDSIEIDDIDLGVLKSTLSEYSPRYPEMYVNYQLQHTGKEPAEIVRNCVNMGWNGKWSLPIQSPFYVWLLENI